MQPRAALLGLVLAAPLLAGCTATADADGDNLTDEVERTAYEIKVQAQGGQQVRHITSDPEVPDTDGDGLLDGEEVDHLTDPRDVDTDGDGLLDGQDLLLHPGDAMHALLLARGIVQHPDDGRFLGEAAARTKPFEWDGDRPFPDGLSDGDELRGWRVNTTQDPKWVQSDPTVPDTDRDGLNDLLERDRGCDPTGPDADHDDVRDPSDADCVHNVKLVVAVTGLFLNQSMDPTGDTDLVLTAQVAGLQQDYRQGLKRGDNNLTFRWVADVPDQGPHHQLVLPLALTFIDQDLIGDDERSGVDKQPICIAGATGACNTLILQVDLFARRFTGPGGLEGVGSGESRGADGAVRFTLQPLLE